MFTKILLYQRIYSFKIPYNFNYYTILFLYTVQIQNIIPGQSADLLLRESAKIEQLVDTKLRITQNVCYV